MDYGRTGAGVLASAGGGTLAYTNASASTWTLFTVAIVIIAVGLLGLRMSRRRNDAAQAIE